MPRLEPKQIQREIDQNRIWPVYWIHGEEQMKSRELLKRIRKAVLGEAAEHSGMQAFSEEVLDASDVSGAQVLDAAQSLSLMGGTRLVVVRDAHLLKETERLAELFGDPAKKEELSSVCVFLSKDLDGRKKFSKQLVQGAAVVACEAVPEQDREAWIQYLSRRGGIELSESALVTLRSMDPWNLDIVEQELEKLSISGNSEEVLLGGTGGEEGTEAFVDALFSRNLPRALKIMDSFAGSPEEALPLLGLCAWNVRTLLLLKKDQEEGTRSVRLAGFLQSRMQGWSRRWTLPELVALQASFEELDFELKQTFRVPLGIWGTIVNRYCSQS